MVAQRKLDFRSKSYGGNAAEYPDISDGTRVQRRRHILLIHGFNTSGAGAEQMYDLFTAHLGDLVRGFYEDVVYVYWPGNWGWPVSLPFYRKDVDVAVGNAQNVANALQLFTGPKGEKCEIIIIAHSLGCRLALEVALRLPQQYREQLTLILLAAAIPTHLCVGQRPYDAADLGLKFAAVYFSGADDVLSSWFRLFESRLRQNANLWWPEAVGHRGGPQTTWRVARPTGHRHTSYWQSEHIAEYVAYHLGSTWSRPEPVRHELLDRFAASRPDQPERTLADRYIKMRQTTR